MLELKMSKNIDDKQKFIELRAEGLSYDKISKEISVSKPTLMKWDKEFSREIDELKYILFEALREKYLMNKKARIMNYGELLEKAKEELINRDFKEVSDDKLISIIIELEKKFKDELHSIKCDSEDKHMTGFIDWGETEKPLYTWILDD